MPNRIYPCLWFSKQAKEAAAFYCSVFNNARITHENPFVSIFEASGQQFMCLDGCPEIKPNPSVSIMVEYSNEAVLNQNWEALLQEGKALMPLNTYPWSKKYGWVQDRFGISWQLMLIDKEPEQKFTPVLMFCGVQQGKAAEAIDYYTSLFPHSSVASLLKYGTENPSVEGQVMHSRFYLHNYQLMAMDSGVPQLFSFNEAVSIVLECKTQEEIDDYWSHLSDGGQESQCGWVKDRFGLWWQVVPEVLGKLMSDPERMPRVSQVFMKMKKFDIAALENA
jgi:predicted 3-demethylubiquinone-9 3-methyltransferase (glyoxalase superfamily)